MSDRPTVEPRDDGEVRVGVHGHRRSDGREERHVVGRVRIGGASAQVETFGVGQRNDRITLGPAPEETSIGLAGEATLLLPPPGGHHMVEAEPLGERCDKGSR